MKRGIGQKISYASGSFSAALLNQYIQSKAQFFYIIEMKLSPIYYGLAIAIWAIWNSINDPLAGWYLDRHPTKWGRRLPWMKLFWLPLIISFGLLWSPSPNWIGNNWLLFLWVLIVLLLFDTGYTVVILSWAALFPEIYTNSEDRNMVSGLRQLFSLFALVFALFIPPFFVKDGDILSYRFYGWVLASICFINLWLSFYGCKEPENTNLENEYSLRDGLKILKENKSYQAFLLANLVTYYSYGQVLAMLPFYRKFVLGFDESFEKISYGGAIFLTLLSLFIWVWLTNRRDPKNTFIFSATWFSFILFILFFVKDNIMIIVLFSLCGIGLAGLLMVVDLLLADIIDEDYLKTKKRREGIYFGINGFFIRLAILLQAISLIVVSELTGFDKNKDIQSDLAQTGILIQIFILPVVFFIVGIIILKKFYYLEGDVLKEQRKQIQL
ncbi:MAG: MFS transporter [Candidatus Heimdallarchaeota archaeon]|nr:MFS transporter [Candidatus Heimdallarchaeota archaeon]MDH5646202.1 MFS transporter [Candidatus Heimdallarchaeota archaeon]